jgi:hypothetical protein
MRQRLVAINAAWDRVCERAAEWQTRLQTALLEVSSYIEDKQKHDFGNYFTSPGLISIHILQ